MENQDEKETKHDTVGWYVFVGCMFVGMGLGMYFDKTGMGLMIGMGIGFLGLGAVRMMQK